MSKTSVWITETQYLGVFGVNSFTEMVSAVFSAKTIVNELVESEIIEEGTITAIEALLTMVGVSAVQIPTKYKDEEVWDGEWVYPLPSLEYAPGKDFTKVLGAHLS